MKTLMMKNLKKLIVLKKLEIIIFKNKNKILLICNMNKNKFNYFTFILKIKKLDNPEIRND